MKKIKLILILVIFASAVMNIYYLYELKSLPVPKNDPREAKYLSMELKKRAVEPAINMLREDKVEEAIIFLKDERLEDNVFAHFYLGLVYFETKKEKEGLQLIAKAIKEEPTLYDGNYPDNVRRILKIIVDKIHGRDELREFRHLIDSKLKGGCG